MKTGSLAIISMFLLAHAPPPTRPQPDADDQTDAWTKTLADRADRGTLDDAFERVRGDSGKWNDEARLQHAPPIDRKPARLRLDDWADQLLDAERPAPTRRDDNWLLFKTRQLDDNDRVWIERIERQGNQFTVVLCEAIWQGRYSKTFTYYDVFGVNLGKLEPGKYEAKWIVKPLVFGKFEGSGGPRDGQAENWPLDERPADIEPVELPVAFSVVAPSR